MAKPIHYDTYSKLSLNKLGNGLQAVSVLLGRLKEYKPTDDEQSEHEKLIMIKTREINTLTQKVEEFRATEKRQELRKEIIRKAMMN